MGHYTHIEATIKLKPEAIAIVALLRRVVAEQPDIPDAEGWWAVVAKTYPQLQMWSKVDRCDAIPYGFGDGIDPENHLVGDLWDFSCRVKNPEKTVETFLNSVIPMLALEENFFLQTDLDGLIRTYQLQNGAVILKSSHNAYDEEMSYAR